MQFHRSCRGVCPLEGAAYVTRVGYNPARVSTPWGIWGVGVQVVIKWAVPRFLRLVAHLFFPEQVSEHRVQVKIRHRVELTEVLLAGYPTGSDLLYPVGLMENK